MTDSLSLIQLKMFPNAETQAKINQINEAYEKAVTYTENSQADFSSYLKDNKSLDEIFTEASQTYGVSKDLLIAMAKQESNFNPNAVSRAGAVGVMQLMPSTAAGLGVEDSYDPYQNIMGGAKYISSLLNKYNGNVSLALAAYNAGGNKVDQYGGIPPYAETQNYVAKITGYLANGVDVPTQVYNTKSTYKNTDVTYEQLNELAGNIYNTLVDAANNEESEVMKIFEALSKNGM